MAAATPAPAVPATPPAAFGICAACHGTTASAPPGVGPNLHGIFGRKAGAVAGYDYSDAMKASTIVWNAQTLTAFVHDAEKTIPGNNMDYPGVADAATVKAIVDYMSTLK
jgi:cytochrome c